MTVPDFMRRPSAIELFEALREFRETFHSELLTESEREEAFKAYVRLFRERFRKRLEEEKKSMKEHES